MLRQLPAAHFAVLIRYALACMLPLLCWPCRYGMLAAECAAMIWILAATYMELPVSTTHSIGVCVGGVGGMGGGVSRICLLYTSRRG